LWPCPSFDSPWSSAYIFFTCHKCYGSCSNCHRAKVDIFTSSTVWYGFANNSYTERIFTNPICSTLTNVRIGKKMYLNIIHLIYFRLKKVVEFSYYVVNRKLYTLLTQNNICEMLRFWILIIMLYTKYLQLGFKNGSSIEIIFLFEQSSALTPPPPTHTTPIIKVDDFQF